MMGESDVVTWGGRDGCDDDTAAGEGGTRMVVVRGAGGG